MPPCRCVAPATSSQIPLPSCAMLAPPPVIPAGAGAVSGQYRLAHMARCCRSCRSAASSAGCDNRSGRNARASASRIPPRNPNRRASTQTESTSSAPCTARVSTSGCMGETSLVRRTRSAARCGNQAWMISRVMTGYRAMVARAGPTDATPAADNARPDGVVWRRGRTT